MPFSTLELSKIYRVLACLIGRNGRVRAMPDQIQSVELGGDSLPDRQIGEAPRSAMQAGSTGA